MTPSSGSDGVETSYMEILLRRALWSMDDGAAENSILRPSFAPPTILYTDLYRSAVINFRRFCHWAIFA